LENLHKLAGAPEVMRGEDYTEKADVYSFGVLLLDMIFIDDLCEYLIRIWNAQFKAGKKSVRTQILRVLQDIWGGWRPIKHETDISKVPGVPPCIMNLIVRCCEHDPNARPSFIDIMTELIANAETEIQRNKFTRNSAFHERSLIESEVVDSVPVNSEVSESSNNNNNNNTSNSNIELLTERRVSAGTVLLEMPFKGTNLNPGSSV
jgi:serine/threonine protein kinase